MGSQAAVENYYVPNTLSTSTVNPDLFSTQESNRIDKNQSSLAQPNNEEYKHIVESLKERSKYSDNGIIK